MAEQFRFQGLDIWKKSIVVTEELFKIGELLQEKKLFRFADQLYGASMSICNNIAEGSGSVYPREFANFINIARRSVFECANILILLRRQNYIDLQKESYLLDELNRLSRMLFSFRRKLLQNQ